MHILVLYATTEGQTRKVARFAARRLVAPGRSVELLPVADAGPADLDEADAAVLAGSLHVERYQPELVGFARDGAVRLAAIPTLFLSVSLSAAGYDPEDREGLARCLARFEAETGWHPGRTVQVAGAFRFTEYDYFKAWMMRRVARDKGQSVGRGEDREYTDWDALGGEVEAFGASLDTGR